MFFVSNYAFALGAGLCVIPECSKHDGRAILEALYGLYDDRDVSPTERLEELARTIRARCGDIVLPEKGSLTFITGDIPYGFAFPELPSTHLFRYPDLGLAIINGFSNEQPGVRGTNVAVLIDPQQTDAPEIDAAARLLVQRGMFVRAHRGGSATVDEVSPMIELYPYDLLASRHRGRRKIASGALAIAEYPQPYRESARRECRRVGEGARPMTDLSPAVCRCRRSRGHRLHADAALEGRPRPQERGKP